jgi:glutaminyl-tRNA synthetase
MSAPAPTPPAAKPANFLRTIIERDLASGLHAKIRTRFPPEPNGYLHIGHAKSICLNFGLAQEHGGACHLRFDDTNPEREEQEYVDAIIEMVRWLGFDWKAVDGEHLYYASDYFDTMYAAAERLIERGLAYVDEQSAEQIRATRGDFTTPGTDSPWRNRSPAENLARFREMRDGVHADGAMVLRAKIDMASPNINLRDPAIYRIRRAHHHNTGDRWCIYPMYTYAHPIEDAIERITHSFCTLEFEDQRPFYDWLLERLAEPWTRPDGVVEPGLFQHPLPKQYEFGKLFLTHVMTSKRKLRLLVEQGIVSGWDDPRMPTLAGLRRRGYTPESVRRMADDTGASKTNIWLDSRVLDAALREHLEGQVARAMAVVDPLPLVLENWAEVWGSDSHREPCQAPAHPQRPELGTRRFELGPRVWIERDDYADVPPKGFFRLFPGNKVRLKYGVVVECIGAEKDAAGQVTAVRAKVVPDTKSGTPGADAVKVKGTITWVAAHDAVPVELRLYDHLFSAEQPDPDETGLREAVNPGSRRVVQGWLEPSLRDVPRETRFQFERHGYFIADRMDHSAGRPVYNRITGLKDGWTPGK